MSRGVRVDDDDPAPPPDTTTPAVDPRDLPWRPFTADEAPALLPKIIS